jgi:uncharacterized protein (DUF1499 family)
MKLSNETREILKNFSTINSNLLIKKGNTVATMSAMKNIVAMAQIPEVFEVECAIYDLNEFLSALSLFKAPVLNFEEKYVHIQEEGSKNAVKYFYTPTDMVKEPKTDIHMPEIDVEFTMTQEEFSQIQRSAAVLGVPDLVVNAYESGEIQLTVTDRKNETSNNYSLSVGDTSKTNLVSCFKTENLKMLTGDYDVRVASVGISHFKNKGQDLEYFIALESN